MKLIADRQVQSELAVCCALWFSLRERFRWDLLLESWGGSKRCAEKIRGPVNRSNSLSTDQQSADHWRWAVRGQWQQIKCHPRRFLTKVPQPHGIPPPPTGHLFLSLFVCCRPCHILSRGILTVSRYRRPSPAEFEFRQRCQFRRQKK